MSFSNRLQSLMHIAACMVAFAIPFPFIAASISVILLVCLWLVRADYRGTWHRLRKNPVLFFWMLFFVLHAIGYFYSEDKADSLFDLQTKLSFLVLPLALGAGMDITRGRLQQILLSFTAGITVIGLFCLIQACVLYHRFGDNQVFFYHDLVRGLNANAVYMAWYVIFSISVLMLFDWSGIRRLGWRLLWFFAVMVQFVFFILLSSKSLLVFFFLFLMPLYYIRHFRRYFPLLQRLLIVAVMLLIAGAIFFSNDTIRNRYREILKKSDNKEMVRKSGRPASNNLSLRLFLWETGLKTIRDQGLWLTGVGNGDVHRVLNKAMHDAGVRNIYTEDPKKRSDLYNVNLHNMYIQSLFMLGIPGLAVFLVIMFSPFAGLRKVPEKILFLVFQVVAVLFLMQESALQTQAGIIFFTFFSQVLWNRYYQGKTHAAEL